MAVLCRRWSSVSACAVTLTLSALSGLHNLYLFLLLRASALPSHGDVELNPGQPSADHVRRDSTSTVGSKFRLNRCSVLFFNAQSLLAKISDLRLLAKDVQPAFIFVVETWLTDSIPSPASVALPGFSSVFRCDRLDRRGGGVLVLARDGIRCSRRPDLEHWEESVWVECAPVYRRYRRILFGCFYRPPGGCIAKFSEALENSFSDIDLERYNVMLLGDFNAASPSWLSTDSLSPAGSALEPLFLQLGLHQLLAEPTHIRPHGPGSLLDLILTSDSSLVSDVAVLPPVGKSDHCLLHHSVNSTSPFLKPWPLV